MARGVAWAFGCIRYFWLFWASGPRFWQLRGHTAAWLHAIVQKNSRGPGCRCRWLSCARQCLLLTALQSAAAIVQWQAPTTAHFVAEWLPPGLASSTRVVVDCYCL